MTPDNDQDPALPLSRRERREQRAEADARTRLPSAAAREVAGAPAERAEQPATSRSAEPAVTPVTTMDDLFTPEASAPKKRRTSKTGCLISSIIVLVVLGAIVFGVSWMWNSYGEQIRDIMGWSEPNDFEAGEATGEASITISDGDTGETISTSLFEAGVTKTPEVFYESILASGTNPTFYPGVYRLQLRMSAAEAMAALENSENKLDNAVLVREGEFASEVVTTLATVLELPEDDVRAAADDYTQFGIPDDAVSIEGYLFPATYTFEPGTSAVDALQRMVDETMSRLDALGVAEADRYQVLTEAALVQRETGNEADMPRVARVFLNRVDQGMKLQSDATVAYGTGNTDTVWTTDEERGDAGNPYNTYVHDGWPVGPIGNPGEAAIKAVLTPAEGNWLYFVPVNLATGETVYSATFEEHERAVAQLQAWCQASEENAVYCE